MLLVLPVILVATIPISIAGWGVRESAMMVAFSYAGLAETDGLWCRSCSALPPSLSALPAD